MDRESRFRLLAWLLGTIAIFGSCAVGWNWNRASKGLNAATLAEHKATESAANWQFSDNLNANNDEQELENDQLAAKNDGIEIEIAELEHKSTAPARAKLARDEQLVRLDRQIVRETHFMKRLGPGPKVTLALEQKQAAHASMEVYSACVTRDQHLAYALGVIWLAFGFSLAFAPRETSR